MKNPFNNSLKQHNDHIDQYRLRRDPEHYFDKVLGFGKVDPHAKQFSYTEMIEFTKQFMKQL